MRLYRSVLLFADPDEALRCYDGAHPGQVHLSAGEATFVFESIEAARAWALRAYEVTCLPVED